MYVERGTGHHERLQKSPAVISGIDHFDRLPDSLLLLIFNKIGDIKALGKCCSVSKRFLSLASQVSNVVVKVDCVISGEDNNTLSGKPGKGVFTNLVRIFYGSLLKPFQALQQLWAPGGGKKLRNASEVSHHSPGEVLRNFKEVQKLRIELPGGELGIEDDILLKWKAEFGSTVDSCVLLGAYRDPPGAAAAGGKETIPDEQVQQVQQQQDKQQLDDSSGSIPESFYTDGSLKSRVVWTISSLIAASARHFLLQQIISEHPTLRSLLLTDADGQGTLSMGREQLEEFRRKPIAASASSNRTQVPALNMKLWYAPQLRLTDGSVLRGATLVAIQPSERPKGKELQEFIAGAFEQPYASAAMMLVKRRTYLLEMNSF